MNNSWIYTIIGFLILFFFISFLFNIFGLLLTILIKFWYIWVIIGVVIYLSKLLENDSSVKKFHNDGKDYIDAEYRVEGDDDEKK